MAQKVPFSYLHRTQRPHTTDERNASQQNPRSNHAQNDNAVGAFRTASVVFEPFIYKCDLFTKTGSGQT